MITEREYQCVYLTPEPPELNPNERCWSESCTYATLFFKKNAALWFFFFLAKGVSTLRTETG